MENTPEQEHHVCTVACFPQTLTVGIECGALVSSSFSSEIKGQVPGCGGCGLRVNPWDEGGVGGLPPGKS